MTQRLVVIGGGQAAASLIAELRAFGDDRPVDLVSDEPVVPYQRPPLSKKYLLGDLDRARLLIRPERWYQEQNVTLHLGAKAETIDRASRRVLLSTGTRLDYDHLALTTGSAPRRLPKGIGGDLPGVYTLRTLADIDLIAGEFAPGRLLLIIGGGYIGLEVAAVAAILGLRVTVIEIAKRILQRVAAPATSNFFRDLHASHGVTIREAVGLSRLQAEHGRVARAVLDNGETLTIDFAIAGIGISPNDGLAAAAGLETDNGIIVDSTCRTSDPAIVAAGDCTQFIYRDASVRLESVQNAADQGAAAAAAVTGLDAPYQPLPWFWSNQFDVKLQIAGLNRGYETTVIRPGKRTGARSVWYYRDRTLLAVDAMNDSAAYMTASRLLKAGRSPDPGQIENPAFDLKSLFPRSRPG